MDALTLRQSLIDGIADAHPELVAVEKHGGRFSAEEVKLIAQQSPAARVSCHGVRQVEDTGDGIDALLTWSVTIITTDAPAAGRDDSALAIVTGLLPSIADHSWGEFAKRPEKLHARNLYSSQLQPLGVAMWSVGWQQWATLGAVDPATLDDLLQVNVEYDLAPIDAQIDARDQIDLNGGTETPAAGNPTLDHAGQTADDHTGDPTTGS